MTITITPSSRCSVTGLSAASLFTTLKVLGIVALCAAAFLLPHAGPPANAPGPAFGGYPAEHAARQSCYCPLGLGKATSYR